MQVLGTFLHSSQTWLWAWANTRSDAPAPQLRLAKQLQAYGEQHGIDLLTVGQFDATPTDLHLVGSVAVGIGNASAYYLANYGAGTMVLALTSEQLNQMPKNDFARIPSVFPQVISTFEMRHRPAFIHYLTQKGYAVTEAANSVSATVETGTLTATFDDLGRLTNLKGSNG